MSCAKCAGRNPIDCYRNNMYTRRVMRDKIIDNAVKRIPDFPKKGILFYDITGILVNPGVFGYCLDKMTERYKNEKIEAVAAIEARGFIFAAPFADRMKIPLILVRKKGKLPGETYSCSYKLEYGEAAVEVHKSDVINGQRILLLDDLIATGGTIEAITKLVESLGGEIVKIVFVMELEGLKGREKLSKYNIASLIKYEGK